MDLNLGRKNLLAEEGQKKRGEVKLGGKLR